jgi:hypothetical protein
VGSEVNAFLRALSSPIPAVACCLLLSHPELKISEEKLPSLLGRAKLIHLTAM